MDDAGALCDTPGVASGKQTLPLLSGILIGSLDEAVQRLKGAAVLHTDIEPSLLCRRAPDGRRRWELVVNIRRNREHQDQVPAPEG